MLGLLIPIAASAGAVERDGLKLSAELAGEAGGFILICEAATAGRELGISELAACNAMGREFLDLLAEDGLELRSSGQPFGGFADLALAGAGSPWRLVSPAFGERCDPPE